MVSISNISDFASKCEINTAFDSLIYDNNKCTGFFDGYISDNSNLNVLFFAIDSIDMFQGIDCITQPPPPLTYFGAGFWYIPKSAFFCRGGEVFLQIVAGFHGNIDSFFAVLVTNVALCLTDIVANFGFVIVPFELYAPKF